MIKTRMSAKMHFTIKLNLVNELIQQLETVRVNDLETVRVHEGLDFV